MRLGNRNVQSERLADKSPPPSASSPVISPGEARVRPAATETTAALLSLLSCVLYCVNGELLQALQLHMPADAGHASPLLNLVLCHLGGILFIPYLLLGQERNSLVEHREHWGNVALPSLLFAALLMGYNYAWLSSAKLLDVSLTNAIFQTSVAFVCGASVLVFGESLTRPRALGVLLALIGSALAAGVGATSLMDAPHQREVTLQQGVELSHRFMTAGVTLALLASLGYAIYQVLFKLWYGCFKGDIKFLAYFGACVSGWHLVFSPLILLAHATGFETLELPRASMALVGTMVSAMIASTVNILYLCIIMWGSPMMLPCASALSVPLTVLFDFVIHGVKPHALACVGHTMVAFSVVLIIQANPSNLKSANAIVQGQRKTLPPGKATDDV